MKDHQNFLYFVLGSLRVIENINLLFFQPPPPGMRDERGPMREDRGPMREERGPMREDRGPMREERGPMRDERGNQRSSGPGTPPMPPPPVPPGMNMEQASTCILIF